MNRDLSPYGALLLRVGLGVVFLAHGPYLKGAVFGLEGTAQFFTSVGLPATLAYLVFLAETLGGIALITGFLARWAALGLVPISLGATWVHWDAGWVFSNAGGGWEYPAVLALAATAQFLLGNGPYALRIDLLRRFAGRVAQPRGARA